MWRKVFSLAGFTKHMTEPLTPKILSDQKHNFVKSILYIYSMESFIFAEMNRASRMKDVSKIKYYGAFASALGFIVHCGNKSDTSFKKEFTVYRGISLPVQKMQESFKVGETINLQGFTSTTLSKKAGVKFAFQNINED